MFDVSAPFGVRSMTVVASSTSSDNDAAFIEAATDVRLHDLLFVDADLAGGNGEVVFVDEADLYGSDLKFAEPTVSLEDT
jgi:hypothetical protein